MVTLRQHRFTQMGVVFSMASMAPVGALASTGGQVMTGKICMVSCRSTISLVVYTISTHKHETNSVLTNVNGILVYTPTLYLFYVSANRVNHFILPKQSDFSVSNFAAVALHMNK